MDRRSFFRSMIGGVAAAAAVRTFPFRVFSFPADLKILNPVVGRTLYRTVAGSNNFIKIGDIMALELENIREEIPTLIRQESALYNLIRKSGEFDVKAFSSKGEYRGTFTVTDVKNDTITVKW